MKLKSDKLIKPEHSVVCISSSEYWAQCALLNDMQGIGIPILAWFYRLYDQHLELKYLFFLSPWHRLICHSQIGVMETKHLEGILPFLPKKIRVLGFFLCSSLERNVLSWLEGQGVELCFVKHTIEGGTKVNGEVQICLLENNLSESKYVLSVLNHNQALLGPDNYRLPFIYYANHINIEALSKYLQSYNNSLSYIELRKLNKYGLKEHLIILFLAASFIQDDKLVLHALQNPGLGIGKSSCEKWYSLAKEQGVSVYAFLKSALVTQRQRTILDIFITLMEQIKPLSFDVYLDQLPQILPLFKLTTEDFDLDFSEYRLLLQGQEQLLQPFILLSCLVSSFQKQDGTVIALPIHAPVVESKQLLVLGLEELEEKVKSSHTFQFLEQLVMACTMLRLICVCVRESGDDYVYASLPLYLDKLSWALPFIQSEAKDCMLAEDYLKIFPQAKNIDNIRPVLKAENIGLSFKTGQKVKHPFLGVGEIKAISKLTDSQILNVSFKDQDIQLDAQFSQLSIV